MSEHDPFQSLWKSQKPEEFSMSLANIHVRAERFQSRVRLRNWIEYAAAALVVAVFGWTAWVVDVLPVRAGCVLIVLGVLYVVWKLATLARAASKRDEGLSWAEFHRAELVRQRDALNGIWRWYLGPLVPGLVVFWLGVGAPASIDAPVWSRLAISLLGLGLGAAVFFGVAALNKAAARKLQAELDALDRARG